MIDAIRDGWGWTGLEPIEVVARNAFGNLLVRDAQGRVWRITPEDLSCTIVAEEDGLAALQANEEFRRDWEMRLLSERAAAAFGVPEAGRCYGLKIPAVLGGAYDEPNLATLPLDELIRASGDLARQIHDLPDGTPITTRIVDGRGPS